MAAVLCAPFRIASLSHCRHSLKIAWQDGAKSEFPNIWLRGSVRDPNFFVPGSWIYNQNDYARFIATESPIVRVKYVDGSEDISVEWCNHRRRTLLIHAIYCKLVITLSCYPGGLCVAG